jgi:hypothetical protein
MKSGLRSIKLLLILVLIGFIGVNPASSAKEYSFPDPYDCYRTYGTITSRMTQLTELYPDLARVKIIGQSIEGRPIQVLQLGREVETNTKPRLVLISGLKANALAQVELNLSFAENLLESYEQDANANWLLEETEIHLILVANPDGRLIAEQQALDGNIPTWTKNRNIGECTTNDGGVALGLNFSYEWAPVITEGCAPNYPGPFEASEPETQAIQTYLEEILAQNPERSLVIDLQNEGDSKLSDKLITPFLYSKTAENPLEDDLYMLASKLSFSTQAMPNRGIPDNRILTGTLTDFAFGELLAPSLRFNLGPREAGGDVTSCGDYFDEILEPEVLAILMRAAMLAAGPLSQAQGPEITFTTIEYFPFKTHITGQADDMKSYKPPLEQDEYSAVHHVAFSLDVPPWSPDAVFTQMDWSEPVSNAPFMMDFEHTFHFAELTPGKHMVYFQAWDTDPSGEPGQAGMINAVVINVPLYTYIPLINR